MPTAAIRGYKIDYQVVVTNSLGFESEEYILPLLGKAKLLKPRGGGIRMQATGKVTASNPALKLTLGFVQSLTGSSHEVVYREQNCKYREFHSTPYPMKDGSGIPWYKDGDANIRKFKDGAVGPFTVTVEDEPRFAYPITRNNHPITAEWVVFHDKFIACFAAKVGSELHYLHEINWNLMIEWGNRQVPAGPAGIRVLSERPIPSYTKPLGMNLETAPANITVERGFA